jgi:hypothetical protein
LNATQHPCGLARRNAGERPKTRRKIRKSAKSNKARHAQRLLNPCSASGLKNDVGHVLHRVKWVQHHDPGFDFLPLAALPEIKSDGRISGKGV